MGKVAMKVTVKKAMKVAAKVKSMKVMKASPMKAMKVVMKAAGEKGNMLTVNAIQDSLNNKGLGIVMLTETKAKSTLAALLKMDHFLLPASVVGSACDLAGSMRDTEMRWMGGGTSLGNELWDAFILPAVRDAMQLVKRKSSVSDALSEAFGILLGLLLFTNQDDAWLCDQEIYCDWKQFSYFFTSVSAAWKAVLASNDAVLGLAPAAGRPGGYRARLLAMLKGWQRKTNATLEEVFDDHVPHAKRNCRPGKV